MNKLMMTTTVALGVMGSALAEDKAAQVYDLTVTVKTTAAKSGTLSPKKNPFVVDTEKVVYRTQATQKWKGLVWGCDCNALSGKWQEIDETSGSVAGCVIWNTKGNGIVYLDDLNWRLLNAIDQKGDKCEGAFTIGNMDEDSTAFLTFAGFGTLAIKYSAAPCEDPELNCTSYLKTMTGNVAGWMPAPMLKSAGRPGDCIFCGESDPGEEGSEEAAIAWDFCPCEEYADLDLTAIAGTWTMKYNASLSKKLKNKADITEVYKFPASVDKQVDKKIDETKGN